MKNLKKCTMRSKERKTNFMFCELVESRCKCCVKLMTVLNVVSVDTRYID